MTLIPKSIFAPDFNETNVGWCSDKYFDRLFEIKAGTIYVPKKTGDLKYIPLIRQTKIDFKFVEDPKGEWVKHLHDFNPEYQTEIHKTAIIGEGTTWGDGLIVEENVIIGSNCSLNFDGFGYHNGNHIPHKGRVIIKSGTRIANNVCIDKAVVGETVIGRDCKIDNLVHIAHNAQVGDGSYIIAGSVICGSVTIGKNVWIAPNATVRDHLTIGDGAIIGLGSVVTKDVKPNQTVMGNPAKLKIRN